MSRDIEFVKRDYQCLFPWTYSHRALAPNRAHPDATRFPILRVVGPMWSFGMRARDLGPVEIGGSSLNKDQLYALRLMYELGHRESKPLPNFPGLRRPVLFSAVVHSFFTTDKLEEDRRPGVPRPPIPCPEDERNDRWRGHEKLSLLAVKTFFDLECNHSRKRRPFRYLNKDEGIQPLADEASVIGDGAVVLAPIGDLPHDDGRRADLPAMQLLQGQIGMDAHVQYLRKVRVQLGVEREGESTDWPAQIYLLPDGFGIYGAAVLPWLSSSSRRVEGWFKITYRSGESSADKIERVMRPWKGPEPARTDHWTKHVAEFARRIVELDAPEHKARWLDVAANASLEPEDFLWKLESDPDFDFLVCRHTNGPSGDDIYVDDRGLICRLAYRVSEGGPQSSLTIEPGQFRLSPLQDGQEGFKIVSGPPPDEETGGGLGADGSPATRYEFKTEPQRREAIFVEGKLDLAVPLVETSARLRSAMGLAEPEQGQPLGLMWAFVPLDSGYLHLPLPNATLSAINRLLEGGAESSGSRGAQDADGSRSDDGARRVASGALSLFNQPTAPGYDDRQRVWSYSLSNVRDIAMSIQVAIDKAWRVEKATLRMIGGEVSLEGFLTLIPYRQTSSRLLPDHADRALHTLSLTALSPSLLRGIEERMWRQSETGNSGDTSGEEVPPAVRVMAEVHKLRFEWVEEKEATRAATTTMASGADQSTRTRLAVNGDIVLETLVRTQVLSEQGRAHGPDSKLMCPWLWIRHQFLPFVQSQPLALAGPDQRQPSGSRELAPLRRSPPQADAPVLRYGFPGALDMRTSAFKFRMDGLWGRPTHDSAWRDEVGMAALTLPSLSIFPGLKASPRVGRVSPPTLIWSPSTRVKYPVELELRHDLAYRDEFYAGASLPQVDPDAEALRASTTLVAPSVPVDDGLFTIRSDNGPDGQSTAVDPASVWQRHWRRLNRMLALAATDERYMVVEEGEDLSFHGPFGERSETVEEVRVSTTIEIDDEGDTTHPFADNRQTRILEAVGSVSILGPTSESSESPQFEFRGLPDEADLIGLNGEFERTVSSQAGGQSAKRVDVAFGAAQLSMEAGGVKTFLDQRGLQIVYFDPPRSGQDGNAPPSSRGTKVRFHLRSGRLAGDAEGGFRLLSLPKPIQAGRLRFWCSDVPLQAGAGFEHPDLTRDGAEELANSASFARNHLRGYRWHLSDAGEKPLTYSRFGLMLIEGLLFEPLRLTGVTLDEEEGPSKFEIRGRVRLAVSDDDNIPPPLSDGEIKLVLARERGKMEFSSRLESVAGATAIEWPLADPSFSTGPVPRLTIAELPALPPGRDSVGKGEGVLSFELGGVQHNTRVKVLRFADGTFRCSAKSSRPAAKGVVQTTRLRLCTETANEQMGNVKPSQLTVSLDAHLVSGQVEALVTLTSDLLSSSVWILRKRSHFSLPGFGAIPMIRNVQPIGGSDAVTFGQAVLGLSWIVGKPAGGNASAPRLLDAFEVESGGGTLTAALLPDPTFNDDSPGPGFKVTDVGLDGELFLSVSEFVSGGDTTAKQSLKLNMVPADHSLRLSGELSVKNWFAWPEVGVQQRAKADGWTQCLLKAGSPARFRHVAKVRLNQQPLDLESSAESLGLLLPAVVEHDLMDLHNGTGSRICKWSAFQLLRIQTLASLAGELKAVASSPARVKDTYQGHLSFLGVQDAEAFDLDSLNHGHLLFEPDAAHHAAISGRLREALIRDITQPNGSEPPLHGAIVELSAHHRLHWLNASGVEHGVVLPLPAVGFLRSKREEREFRDSTVALFESRSADDIQFYLPDSELEASYGTEILDRRTRQQAVRYLQSRYLEAAPAGYDLASWMVHGCEPASQSTWHRPVFQSHGVHQSTHGAGVELVARAYPALAVAPVIADLAVRGIEERPESYTFAQIGALTLSDLLPGEGAKYDARHIDHVIEQYREWAYRNLVASPDKILGASQAPASRNGVTLELLSANRAGTKMLQVARIEREEEINVSGQDDDLYRDWARRSLQRLAPWARIGLLLVTPVESGGRSRRSGYIQVDSSGAGRPGSPAVLHRPKPQQGQYSPHLNGVGGLNEQVAVGFIPVSVGAGLYASEDAFVPGSRTDGPKLTATGAEMSWVLLGGDTAVLSEKRDEGGSLSYWITDRARVSYRRSASHLRSIEKDGQTTGDERWRPPLTHALPEDFQARLPGALLPAAALLAPANATESENPHQQYFLPGYNETNRISLRAGVWATNRLGILAIAGNDKSTSSGEIGLSAAPETPVHMRTPRPPLLAINDRPRASSHESGHLALTQGPTAILHGPRARRAGSATVPLGLDRRPRSQSALVLGFEDPGQPKGVGDLSKGLMTTQWSGRLEIIDTGAVAISQPVAWLLETTDKLRLVVRDRPFYPLLPKQKTTDNGALIPVPLLGTEFSDFRDSDGNRLQDLIDGFPPGTPIQLAVQVYLSRGSADEGGILYRKFVLELLWGGATGSLMERPVFARFDDPEYNDRLEGVAKLDRRPTPRKKGDELVLAADRPDVRADDRIEFAIGLKASQAGADIEAPFRGNGGYADLKMEDGVFRRVGLSFSRLRAGSGEVLKSGSGVNKELPFELLGVEHGKYVVIYDPIKKESITVKCYRIPMKADFTTSLSAPGYELSNAALIASSAPPPDGTFLRPGDQVVVTLFAFDEEASLDGQSDNRNLKLLARLLFDVVVRPLLPANPSAFALLKLTEADIEPAAPFGDGKQNSTETAEKSAPSPDKSTQVSVPLYASGPPAAIIELVDPLDLLDGIVRRRAIYQWRAFTRNHHATWSSCPSYALQKINAVGGTWLPSNLEADWYTLSTDRK